MQLPNAALEILSG